MRFSPRRLATLLPVLLWAISSLLLLSPSGATAVGAAAPVSAVSAPHGPAVPEAPAAPASRQVASPEPHFGASAGVRVTAAVENPVRFPGAPAAPAPAIADVPVPARGVVVGDPRRERAPPGGSHGPRDPRGPPSPRHD
ncbi:hypothetical protein [Streptomyces sp. NPDC093089]|uniref:hypothetical protein n=1 Tax=Streptomyces sp. NPDC093089 TaxID=3366024 RepID=UPI00381F338E